MKRLRGARHWMATVKALNDYLSVLVAAAGCEWEGRCQQRQI
jgi:hypothetical protein